MAEKRCDNCKYSGWTEEYWHDHYLIQPHIYCAYNGYLKRKDVERDHCCSRHEFIEGYNADGDK